MNELLSINDCKGIRREEENEKQIVIFIMGMLSLVIGVAVIVGLFILLHGVIIIAADDYCCFSFSPRVLCNHRALFIFLKHQKKFQYLCDAALGFN